MKKSSITKSLIATGLIGCSIVGVAFALTSCGKNLQTYDSTNKSEETFTNPADVENFFNKNGKVYNDGVEFDIGNGDADFDAAVDYFLQGERLNGYNCLYSTVRQYATYASKINPLNLKFKNIDNLGGSFELTSDFNIGEE
jgi:hypothetical protein